jgi:transcriptional regulator with XRE-family HTH domain
MSDLNRVFSDRLNLLMGERTFGDKKVTRLAAACDTDRARVHAWLKGDGTPRAEALVSVAKFFDVSTDFLLGLSDVSKPENHQESRERV